MMTLAVIGTAAWFLMHGAITGAAAPMITNIAPDNGPIAGGTVITVTGSGFMGQYQRVEALVFDGASYIDTGVSQMNHDINVRFNLDASNTSSINMVFGNSNSGGASMFNYGRAAGSGATPYTAWAGSGTSTAGSDRVRVGGSNDVTLNWTRIYNVNGSQIATFGAAPTTAGNIWIGGAASPASYYRGLFYRMRTLSSGLVDHNFVPVRRVSTGEYGVVDTVTWQFYGNSGSGTIGGGTTINGVFELDEVIPGTVSPDAPLQVLIDNRPCTGVNVISDTELTCHTPSGLSLGKKDVTVYIDSINQYTVANGFEYALRLNSIYPKFGPVTGWNTIEIDGGVFQTPPEQYESVDGVVFDGISWIETGFNPVDSTKISVTYQNKNGGLVPAGGNIGFLGARAAGSTPTFVVWQGVSAATMRSDFNLSTGATGPNLSTLPYPNIYTITKDDNLTQVIRQSDNYLAWSQTAGSGVIPDSLQVEMLIGSLSHGGAFGTNGATAYGSFQGVIYSAYICKNPSNPIAVPAGTVYQIDNDRCGPNRVLVRDFRSSRRDTDNAIGFYDMVTGEFIENAGFGNFTAASETLTNELEVPVEINVTVGGQTCTNPQIVTGTKISCVVPPSNLPGDGEGRVTVEVFANGVQATPGTSDASDYYYGSPMVIDTISPNRGPSTGGQTVTISGNNFYQLDADAIDYWQSVVVEIGGSPCVIANLGDFTNTAITCTTSANAGGISDVFVDNGVSSYLLGGSVDPITGAITSGYLYEDLLLSVTPNTGPSSGGTSVTIKGTGFQTVGAGTTRVFFGGAAATNVVVVNSTTITATTPARAPGAVDILVIQEGFAAALSREAVGAYTYYFQGSTSALTPNKGYTTGGDSVIINGTGFDIHAAATATFGGVAATDVTVLSTTQVRVTTPAHAVGMVDVTVTQFGVTSTITNGFEYIPPLAITSIEPNRGSIAGGTVVVIYGQSFIPAGATAASSFIDLAVLIGGVPCVVENVSYFTNTVITCTTGAHAAGVVDVTVTTGAGANHTDTMVGATNPSTGDVTSGFLYILTGIAVSSNSVAFGLVPGTVGSGNTIVSVTTDNPTGYALKLRANSQGGVITNPDWLKCTDLGSTAKFLPVSVAGPLAANTWGWATGLSAPSSWKAVPLSDATMVPVVNHPTGPGQDGSASDSYTLWFGAFADMNLPPCAYSAHVMVTVLAQ